MGPQSRGVGVCKVVLVFAALGVYLFFHMAQVATGGPAMPLGEPLLCV